jgi:predicted ester cyclase
MNWEKIPGIPIHGKRLIFKLCKQLKTLSGEKINNICSVQNTCEEIIQENRYK